MESLYLIIPLSGLVVIGIALAIVWAVRSGQFEDLDGPPNRILFDDDRPAALKQAGEPTASSKDKENTIDV
jgi:cbb3-type cytochrome oxidase maturation protein